MFAVAVPWLLAAPALVAAIGLFALWRGRRGVMRVSSTRLWQGLDTVAAGGKQRSLDPVWLLVFLAAVSAALALPGVRWQNSASDLPSADVEAAIRTGATTQLFLRATNPAHISQALNVQVNGNTLLTAPVAELALGKITDIPSAGDRLTLTIQHEGHTVFERSFSRQSTPPFGIVSIGRANSLLQRAFSIHANGVAGDATLRPLVILADDSTFTTDASLRDALVITFGRSLPEGITARAPSTRPAGQMPRLLTTQLLPADALNQVKVAASTSLQATSDWQTLAETDLGPWLLYQRDPKANVTRLHMASIPGQETDWPAYPSFVIFCASLLEEVSTQSGADTSMWVPLESATTQAVQPRSIHFGSAFIVIAMLLTTIAVLMLLARTRT